MRKKYLEILKRINIEGFIYDKFSEFDFRCVELDGELVKINPKYYELFGLIGQSDSDIIDIMLNGALEFKYEIDDEVLRFMAKYSNDEQIFKIRKLVIYNSYNNLERSVNKNNVKKIKIKKKNFKKNN